MLLALAGVLAWQTVPDACETHIGRAKAAFEDRRFSDAAAEFRKALGVCPRRSIVLIPLAQVEYLLGDAQSAETRLLEAVGEDPNNTQALYALGRIYYEQNRFPAAIEHLQRVVELEPAHYRAHNALALCYDAVRRDADALRHFYRALDLVHKDHPEYDTVYADFAGFFLRRGQLEKAFQLGAEAAQRNPAAPRNFFLTGKALVGLGKHALSLRWFEEAVRLDPGYAEAWYALAQAYRKLGKEPEARRALERFEQARSTSRPRR
jgi:tetratricopeptide (TPR) repeat protein